MPHKYINYIIFPQIFQGAGCRNIAPIFVQLHHISDSKTESIDKNTAYSGSKKGLFPAKSTSQNKKADRRNRQSALQIVTIICGRAS
jgi:hypothetical protein